MTKDEIINRIVDRFLQWKLPEDFRPDCGIEFDRDKYVRLNPLNRPFKPFGTNLLTATQATAMVKAIVGPEIEALINEARGEPVAHQAHRHVTDNSNVYEVPDGVECPFCRIAAAPKQED